MYPGTVLLASLGLSCAAFCATAVDAPITTGGLIDEMLDMQHLTRFPAPAFKTIQFSSYDRQSSVPGGKHWFANSDGFGGEPIPNFEAVLKEPQAGAPGEYLMCDVEGPGAIVRLWTAKIAGSVRVVLDNASTPIYEGAAEAFFRHPYNAYLGGTDLTPEVLTGAFYQRDAAYAPIPFAKRCRIEWIGDHKDIHFYAIQIRKYEPSAKVVTFTPNDVKASAERIRRVASVLAEPDRQWPYRSTREPINSSVTVGPHAVVKGLRLDGGGALERLVIKVDAPKLDEALRQTILHIQCDEHPWGQVQAPVGDFFGAGPGVNPYSSVPFSVSPDGTMTSRYVMPYKNSLQISFDNRGDQPVTISCSALPMDYTWDETSMYFRARWRVNHGLVASGDSDSMGVQDLPFLIARGRGVYVGTTIMLLNPNTIPTPGGNWWGEGDEKIFVDDDVRPSTFGTGSEDYFNYAWSAPDLFAFPYCGQPRNDGPANRGHVVNYRWHLLDPLPFSSSIAFYMELFSHERTENFSYARLAYHYAQEGLMDDHVAITDSDTRIPQLPPQWEPAPRGGAAKYTFVACEDLALDKASTSIEKGPLWQGGQVLVWTPTKAGDELHLAFSVPEDGDYELSLACMFRPDGGGFKALVDGKPIAFDGHEATSLKSAHHVLSRLLGVGAGHLAAGKHQLILVSTEAGRPIGLDFLGHRVREH